MFLEHVERAQVLHQAVAQRAVELQPVAVGAHAAVADQVARVLHREQVFARGHRVLVETAQRGLQLEVERVARLFVPEQVVLREGLRVSDRGVEVEASVGVDGKPRFGAPVTGISKFVAIGLNYVDHAKETGNPIPPEPIFFLKANTSLSGPNDAVEMPRESKKLDWEVEIAAIIGTRAKYVSEADALNHVAGYCVCNDVSERYFQQERGGQWTKGKSHDTFGPVGPWLVTKDEIPNVQKLSMWLDVNGERRQTGSTSTMIFTMAKCISYVSTFLTLLPGDIITTGTPPGVGAGRKPPLPSDSSR